MRQKVALAARARALTQPFSSSTSRHPVSIPKSREPIRRQLLADRRAAGCAILVSTHNLDEAERIADRVAVLQGRLIAVGPPRGAASAAHHRLACSCASCGDPSSLLKVARRFDPDAAVDGPTLAIRPGDAGAKTPAPRRRRWSRPAPRILEVAPGDAGARGCLLCTWSNATPLDPEPDRASAR